MAEVGYFALVLGIFLSLYGIVAFIIGVNRKNSAFLASGKAAVLGVAILTSVTTAALLYFLMSGDYSIDYVYQYTSNDLPVFYRFSAWWAGNAGSLLLWAFLLSWYTVIVAFSKKTRNLTPYASSILLFNSAFFLFVIAFLVNPFVRTAGWAPGLVIPDGAGMNALLQNPGMVFHPVTTYLGYVGFAVPFAYAMTALITRNADDQWIKVTRRWTIVAWMFLSLGNIWGAQWAYSELGWGGYWGWDPVENASFIPWLTGSAFIHSVMVQERKDMLKVWNVALIAVTYCLTLFGTFLVRSGVLTSVHAFGSGSLGNFFLAFTVFMLFASAYLIVDRHKLLAQERSFESFLSKESSFLLNNLVLVGMAFAVFWGTMFPLVSEAVRGVKVTVGAPFFNSVSLPLGLALFALMGICPLIAWRKASIKHLRDNFLFPAIGGVLCAIVVYFLVVKSIYAVLAFGIAFFTTSTIFFEIFRGMKVRHRLTGEEYPVALGRMLVRNRRRYGGYIVHLGVVLMLVGITGSHSYNLDLTKTVKPGESMKIGGYTLTYNKLDQKAIGPKDAVYADLALYKNGTFISTVEPQKVFYPPDKEKNPPATEVGLYSTLKEDVYVILADWKSDGSATFKVFLNPLVAWLWIGGYVLVFGVLFALWPGKGSQAGSKYIRTVPLEQAE